jgi:hypothetical protein
MRTGWVSDILTPFCVAVDVTQLQIFGFGVPEGGTIHTSNLSLTNRGIKSDNGAYNAKHIYQCFNPSNINFFCLFVNQFTGSKKNFTGEIKSF